MQREYDSRPCFLGEGPLWHPLREQLFWFDVLNKRLLSRVGSKELEWVFEHRVSAAAWVDKNTLLIASEMALLLFDIEHGSTQVVAKLEANNASTRSNDGRADPHGGFWISTMGLQAEHGAGAIYRYFRGELRQLHQGLSIPNSICFSNDGCKGYFADTARQKIWVQRLDALGWPVGSPDVFVDLESEGLFPDGSVVDAQGCLWNAQWGSGSVAQYSPAGQCLSRHPVGASQSTCPAFGGAALKQLFVTTAQEGLAHAAACDGRVYQLQVEATGVAEPCVILSS